MKGWYLLFIHSWDSASWQLLYSCDFNILVVLGFNYTCHIAFLYQKLYIIYINYYYWLFFLQLLALWLLLTFFIISKGYNNGWKLQGQVQHSHSIPLVFKFYVEFLVGLFHESFACTLPSFEYHFNSFLLRESALKFPPLLSRILWKPIIWLLSQFNWLCWNMLRNMGVGNLETDYKQFYTFSFFYLYFTFM